MDSRDFSNIGDKIRNTVEDAMNSANYQQLNQKINQTVDMAMNEARRQFGNYQRANKTPYVNVPNQQPGQMNRQPVIRPQTIRVIEKGKYSAPLMIIGGVLSSLFWTIPLIAGVLLAFHIIPVPSGEVKYTALTIAYSFVFLILSLIVVCKGISLGKRYRYFKMYRSVLNDREFCSVKELAEKTRESEKSVCRNLRKMIKARMFWDGFLDEKGTCLIVSRTAYEQYQMALESRRQREEETVKMEAERASESPVEQMIRKGNEYIECIREANDAIPGEVISAKLDRLEMIIRKIFESVKQHPEQMNEMDKFMEYYLPTTQKLVNAYKEFDALPVKGENVTNSMNEIENTLDTISHAFEQLLDDLFQDAAFDISSDISVLQTMLAREGYKEKDFK